MTIFIKKLCNAFIANAAGGAWIGGAVAVSANALDWMPHAKDAAHPVHIPLLDVRAVRSEFGLLTGTVVLELVRGGEFRFRCFNARNVAEHMSDLLPRQELSA